MDKIRVKILFDKIRKANKIYLLVGNEKRRKILNALEFVFEELKDLGINRTFSEGLLLGGKRFVDTTQQQMISNDRSEKTPIVGAGVPATIKMTSKEQREYLLARKHGALAWVSLETPGDTVKIEVLLKQRDTS